MRIARAVAALTMPLLLVACPSIQEYVVYVAPKTAPCTFGLGAPDPAAPYSGMNCIQTSRQEAGPFYLSYQIKGFTLEPGYKYKLMVRSLSLPFVDGGTSEELIAVLEKTPVSNFSN
jgi:Domain of unknown function (DUF4377)